MDLIDQFSAITPDGKIVSITMLPVLDDPTWFEVYATDEFIGKVHWRADTDAYMATDSDGTRHNVAALTEAEDWLVRRAGYYNVITSVTSVQSEPMTSSENDQNNN